MRMRTCPHCIVALTCCVGHGSLTVCDELPCAGVILVGRVDLNKTACQPLTASTHSYQQPGLLQGQLRLTQVEAAPSHRLSHLSDHHCVGGGHCPQGGLVEHDCLFVLPLKVQQVCSELGQHKVTVWRGAVGTAVIFRLCEPLYRVCAWTWESGIRQSMSTTLHVHHNDVISSMW